MIGLQPRYTSEVAQQFASRDELHDEIEVAGVLTEPFEVDLGEREGATMKGCCRMLRIWLSFCTWSICFDFRISIFLRILAAKNLLDCRCLTSLTLPKVPELLPAYPRRWSPAPRSPRSSAS